MESENEEYLLSRDSHSLILEDRNWSLVTEFWSTCITVDDRMRLPFWVLGSSSSSSSSSSSVDFNYGITNIKEIHEIGKDEYNSLDPRHKRQTFAIRIGYNGCEYRGYQMQKGLNNNTVEGDIYNALGLSTNAAGRTDSNVSAISQVISFHSHDNLTPDDILQKLKDSDACKSKRLGAWDCYRVPRKFHALFSATWRRYLYLLPLKVNEANKDTIYDIDVEFVNLLFQKLEGLPLSYNAFAYREWITSNDDICTLYKSSAFLVDLDISDSFSHNSDSSDRSSMKKPAMCVELVGTRFLRRMVRILVATACKESLLPSAVRDPEKLLNLCKEGDRKKAHSPINGIGLAMAGVGYPLNDLKPKHGISRKRKL